MTQDGSDWLAIERGDAPLIVTFPHTGTHIPDELQRNFTSLWHARRDADWWIDQLYDFVRDFGATTIRTCMSRSVIDVNRDPSGASLYPGQATTELCPTTDFDGVHLYVRTHPNDAEIAHRRSKWFVPYHEAIAAEVARLRRSHDHIVLYDAHSIRSHIPHLFAGKLPLFNIGTNGGTTCDPALSRAVEAVCAASGESYVVDGRFKGGWTTRHYGQTGNGVHAIQMELAQRGYMAEPAAPAPHNWPSRIDAEPAVLPILRKVIEACLLFAKGHS